MFEQQGRVGFAGGFLTSCVGCHFVKYRHAFSKFQGTVGVLHGVLHISVPKSYRCSLSCAMSLEARVPRHSPPLTDQFLRFIHNHPTPAPDTRTYPNMNKVFNTIPSKQKLAAWATAGAVFGAWQYFDGKDEGKVLTQIQIDQQNKSIAGTDKLKEVPKRT